MPLSIPAFDQYQQPLIPLRGLWNHAPKEGDKFVNAEIDWLVTTRSSAVQFSLSGNSPVSLSQIAALSVDNSRSGSDVDFVFPDSGFVLTVPAHNQLIAPVFTNALMFYASAPNAIAGDTTVFQILNSVPPPIPIQPSTAQNHAGATAIPVTAGTTQLIPPGINGTLNSLNLVVEVLGGAAEGIITINLIDGTGATLWAMNLSCPAGVTQTSDYPISGLSVRFINGLRLLVGAPFPMASGAIVVNSYYSVP